MKVVILAGGFGTRLSEETLRIPKPMVYVNNKPFLLHLIEQCKSNGIKEFILLVGYKYQKIKTSRLDSTIWSDVLLKKVESPLFPIFDF